MPPTLRVVVAMCATCTLRKLSSAGTLILEGAISPVTQQTMTRGSYAHEVRSLGRIYYGDLEYIGRRINSM